MTDEATPGVLLTGEDGKHYFIPNSDLSQYAVGDVGDAAERVADAAPQIAAFSVSRGDEDDVIAFFPMTG
jgi:hypothetical protein